MTKLVFCFYLDAALKDPEDGKFFVPEKIEEFRGFGGVRIEDDVIITRNGSEVINIMVHAFYQLSNLL